MSAAWADDYQIGQGLQLGRFQVSGYANVVVESPRGTPRKLSVDDLSIFVTGRVNRWLNPFLEAEISSATLVQQGNGPRSRGHLVMERFYDDIIVSEEDTLRVGKILSPVGDWNLIHAAPLVPTTTRPLTTHNGFAEYANGIAWLHDPGPGAGPGWQIYLQPGREWLPRPNDIAPDRYRNVSGAHVSWSNGLSNKVGISFQQGETVNLDERYRLVGINARTSFGKLMLESEAKVSRWSGAAARARDKELGIYALADYAFTPRWHGVLEWEHYQGHHGNEPSRNTLVGVAYRPDPSMVWKFEYVHQTGDASEIPSGWLASFSVLF